LISQLAEQPRILRIFVAEKSTARLGGSRRGIPRARTAEDSPDFFLPRNLRRGWGEVAEEFPELEQPRILRIFVAEKSSDGGIRRGFSQNRALICLVRVGVQLSAGASRYKYEQKKN